MLVMHPDCERCGADLPPEADGAMICSFECTFCAPCVAGALAGRCPNCGGDLQPRPKRVGGALDRHPGSMARRHQPGLRP